MRKQGAYSWFPASLAFGRIVQQAAIGAVPAVVREGHTYSDFVQAAVAGRVLGHEGDVIDPPLAVAAALSAEPEAVSL